MIGYIIVSVFILMLVLFVYFAYKNEKKYQEEKQPKRPSTKKEEKKPQIKPKQVPSAKELEAKKAQEERLKEKRLEEKRRHKIKLQEQRLEEKRLQEKKLEEQRLEKKKLEKKKPEPELISEPEVTEKIDLPECNYPKFDHSRLMDMGLSPDEAKEFVAELIPQIEAQIPLIKEAMEIPDFHNMEKLTHSIKGSSTTVGTGGISDLLVEFNTYLKTGTELAIVEAYLASLKHYTEELKEQYS